MRFPAARRLRIAAEFARVRAEGASFPGRFVVVNVLKVEPEAPSRSGIITSRKVGGAVQRNKVRRRLREIIRESSLRSGFWVVTIARWRAADATHAELLEDWRRAAKRAGLLQPKPTGAVA